MAIIAQASNDKPMMAGDSVEEQETQVVGRRQKVWLECNGEAYDFREVRAPGAGLMVNDDDVAVVEFICPRCRKKHQSVLFR